MTAFLTACAVLSGLQLLLSRTSWGRKVRATADDLDTARLVGIRVRAGVFLLVRRTFGLDARAVGSDPVAAASAGVRVGRIRRLAYFVAAGGAGAVGALIALQTLYVEPTTVFNIQYSVDMLFMVLIGGMGTIEGPVLGALVLFGLQEALSSYGAWYLVIVGGLAVAATLVSSRGLWGFAAERFGWSLLPVGYRMRPPRG